MGNCYLIMFLPNVWNYELFELYLPGSSWNPSQEIRASTDYESYSGRKNYAFATAGGYYATRLPILEYLNKMKKQASVLVIRIETPSYWASLGVSTKKIGKTKFKFDISDILRRSRLLDAIKTQMNLRKWF